MRRFFIGGLLGLSVAICICVSASQSVGSSRQRPAEVGEADGVIKEFIQLKDSPAVQDAARAIVQGIAPSFRKAVMLDETEELLREINEGR